MKKINMSLFVLSLILVSSIFIMGQKQKVKNMPKDKHRIDLNLTDEQEVKIQDIRFTHEEKQIEIKSELDKNRLQIKKLIASGNFSDNQLLNLVDKSGQIQSELEKNRVAMWLDIRNILTDEQKEIWKDRFQKMGRKDKMLPRRDRDQGIRGSRPFERDQNREKQFND